MGSHKQFLLNLTRFLHGLCHGYLEFESEIEITGYINVCIDRNTKEHLILQEIVKNIENNSISVSSDSFLAEKSTAKQTKDAWSSPDSCPDHSCKDQNGSYFNEYDKNNKKMINNDPIKTVEQIKNEIVTSLQNKQAISHNKKVNNPQEASCINLANEEIEYKVSEAILENVENQKAINHNNKKVDDPQEASYIHLANEEIEYKISAAISENIENQNLGEGEVNNDQYKTTSQSNERPTSNNFSEFSTGEDESFTEFETSASIRNSEQSDAFVSFVHEDNDSNKQNGQVSNQNILKSSGSDSSDSVSNRMHPTKKYKCCLCMQKYFSFASLSKHINHDHEVDNNKRELTPRLSSQTMTSKFPEEKKGKNDVRTSLFKCNLCEGSFTQKGSLKTHLRIHSGYKPFKCHFCAAAFPVATRLREHMRSHTGERPFQCNICSASFATKRNLQRHIMIHTGEKPYKCKACSAAFTCSAKLKKHMRKHTGEKPFQCKFCLKSFSILTSLTRHIKLHFDEKKFKCKICSATFSTSEALMQHSVSSGHNVNNKVNNIKFNCEVCPAVFSQEVFLIKHAELHKNKKVFTCDICLVSYSKKFNLKRHSLTHTAEKPYRCKICSKSFKRKDTVETHMRIHTSHGIIKSTEESIRERVLELLS